MCLRNNAKIISSGGDTSDQALSQAAPYAIAKLCYCNPLTLLSPTTANHHVMPTPRQKLGASVAGGGDW